MSCRGAVDRGYKADEPDTPGDIIPFQKPKGPDDLLTQAERDCLDRVMEDCANNDRCPHIRKASHYFFYCGKGLPEGVVMEMRPSDAVYNSHVDTAELQLWCLDSFPKCCVYTGQFVTKTRMGEA